MTSLSDTDIRQVIVIGSGPAGYTAALEVIPHLVLEGLDQEPLLLAKPMAFSGSTRPDTSLSRNASGGQAQGEH